MNSMESKSPRKQAALSFLELVVAGKVDEAYDTFVSRSMRHHNPSFAGDAESLKKAMKENYLQFPRKIFEPRHWVEEGDLVAVHSKIRLHANGPSVAALHLFRFEGDRIAEMWDVGQPVPEDSPNQNGMF
jgi:predicted SnoaL-like aldol condensation-catalyzing enzyme